MYVAQAAGLRRRAFASSLKQLVAVFTFLMVAFWLVGGFMSSGSDGGDGFLGVTLTALFDPSISPKVFGWSSLLPDLPADNQHSEHLSFMGVATIPMIGLWLVSLFSGRLVMNIRQVALTACTIILFVFSLSPTVMFGPRKLFSYNLPPILEQIAGTFRTMGRYDWPLIYLVMAFGLLGLQTIFRRNLLSIAMLLMLLLVQVADMQTANKATRDRFMTHTYSSPLISPKWNEMGHKYKHLQTIPALNFDPNWFDFAIYADKWQLTSSAAGIARVNEDALSTLNEELQMSLTQQNFKKDTLYVLTNYPTNPMSQTLLDKYGPGSNEKTKAFMLDGFTVIAP
jgi:hypothetical protein